MSEKLYDVISASVKVLDRWEYKGKEYVCSLLFPSSSEKNRNFIIFIIGEIDGDGTVFLLDDFRTTWRDGVIEWENLRDKKEGVSHEQVKN